LTDPVIRLHYSISEVGRIVLSKLIISHGEMIDLERLIKIPLTSVPGVMQVSLFLASIAPKDLFKLGDVRQFR
jgi:hypothetical protein